jgi:hypothetical protein
MRKGLVLVIALVGTVSFATISFAEQAEPAAEAAAEASSEEGKVGGCMPDGGCCGGCQAARAAQEKAKAEGKPAAAVDCPCKRRQKALEQKAL